MNKENILKKALEKAVKNGFRIKNLDYNNNKEMSYFCDMVISDNLYNLIFSHEFAKAFWKEKKIIRDDFGELFKEPPRIQDWKYHLQQLVLEKEPLKYLEKFLKNGKDNNKS